MEQRKPTIRDVARTAGVGVGTASHVLQGKDHLHTPETTERVWVAVRRLGYRPNRVARNLAKRRTYTIGVVIERYLTRLSHNIYYSHVLDGVLEAATPAGYQVSIIPVITQDSPGVRNSLESGSVDGLILVAPAVESPIISWVRESGIPAIAVGCVPSDSAGNVLLPGVDVDNFQAQYDVVNELLKAGHRKICYLSGPSYQQSAQLRLAGYRKAMTDAGVSVEESWIVNGMFSLEGGSSATLQLFKGNPGMTALAAANDMSALGAMEALRDMGLRVPQDVSVTGIDDIGAASLSAPPLTTVRQPIDEIGTYAAKLLVQWIEKEKMELASNFLAGSLVLRESIATRQ
jgi:LacI family transcriptional regulator